MSRAGERLRAETQQRAKGEWRGKLTKIGMWLQAANWLDEQGEEPERDWPTQEVLAYALLCDATEGNGHPKREPWPEVDQRIKDIWMVKAKRLQRYIDREVRNASS